MLPIHSQLRNLRRSRNILIAAFGMAFPLSLLAQSVSPNLSPKLTDNPETEPIVTLAPDLLLPTRTFIYDATGSSLTSNGLTPFVYANSQGIAATQTDTQVRDSSQTGHVSPYGLGVAARLGLGSSTGEGQSSAGSSLMSSGMSGGMSVGGSQTTGSGFGNSVAASSSGWGGAISGFGIGSSDPSWGTSKLQLQRLGRSQTDSSNSGTSQTSDSTGLSSGSNTTGSATSLSSKYSSTSGSGHHLGASGLNRSGSLARGSRSGIASTGTLSQGANLTPGSPGGMSTGDQSLYSSSSNLQGSSLFNGPESHSSMSSHGGGSSGGFGIKSSVTESLDFMPKFSTEPVFGSSPFSSPAGEGELTFLNPSILRVTSPRSSSSLSHNSDSSAESYGLHTKLNAYGGLASSSNHYGLPSHLNGSDSLKSKNSKKRTRLKTSLQDSGNPSSYMP